MQDSSAMSPGRDILVNPRVVPTRPVQLIDYGDEDDDDSIPDDVIIYNSTISCLC